MADSAASIEQGVQTEHWLLSAIRHSIEPGAAKKGAPVLIQVMPFTVNSRNLLL